MDGRYQNEMLEMYVYMYVATTGDYNNLTFDVADQPA